jgi:hypothetical protein
MIDRTYCRRGHDLTAPMATYADGSCVNCAARDKHLANAARKRSACKKGHDLTLPGATATYRRTNGKERTVCVKCAANYRELRRSQKRRDRCAKGHSLIQHGTYPDGSCKMCRKIWRDAQATRTTPRRNVQQEREDTIRTRRMLDLMREIEQCATHWEREPLQQEFARLQAMGTGGDE